MQLTLDFSFVKIESIFYKIKSLCYKVAGVDSSYFDSVTSAKKNHWTLWTQTSPAKFQIWYWSRIW